MPGSYQRAPAPLQFCIIGPSIIRSLSMGMRKVWKTNSFCDLYRKLYEMRTHTHTFRQMPLSEPISEYTCWMVHALHGFKFAAASDRSRQSVNVALQCDRNDCKAYNIPFTPPPHHRTPESLQGVIIMCTSSLLIPICTLHYNTRHF